MMCYCTPNNRTPFCANCNQAMYDRITTLESCLRQAREAFQTYIDEHEECSDADDWLAMMCSVEAHHVANEALAAIDAVLTKEK